MIKVMENHKIKKGSGHRVLFYIMILNPTFAGNWLRKLSLFLNNLKD